MLERISFLGFGENELLTVIRNPENQWRILCYLNCSYSICLDKFHIKSDLKSELIYIHNFKKFTHYRRYTISICLHPFISALNCMIHLQLLRLPYLVLVCAHSEERKNKMRTIYIQKP